MSESTYFEGATADFFVKAVQFGEVVQGELTRHRIQEMLHTPDAWTLYRMPRDVLLSHMRHRAVRDYFNREEAIAAAQQLALENKTEALLRGHPTD